MSAYDAFADYTDLETRLGITINDTSSPNDASDRADALLAAASDLVRSASRQVITLVEDDELVRRGTGDNRIRLPQGPVIEVSEVTVRDTRGLQDAVTLPEGDYYVDGDYLVRTTGASAESSFDVPAGAGWWSSNYELTITYSHGYEIIPQVVKSITLEVAARIWINPGAVGSEGHGSEQAQYGDSPGLLLRADEQARLDRWSGHGTIRTAQLS